jgi:hypothetical protein
VNKVIKYKAKNLFTYSPINPFTVFFKDSMFSMMAQGEKQNRLIKPAEFDKSLAGT